MTDLEPRDLARALALLERIYDPRNLVASKRYHVPKGVPGDDVTWLCESGLDPNATRVVTHDDAIGELHAARATAPVDLAARAFVASLADDESRVRGAYIEAALLAHGMPEHAFSAPRESTWCRVCGLAREETFLPAWDVYAWHRFTSPTCGWVLPAVQALRHLPSRVEESRLTRGKLVLAHALRAIERLPATARAGAAIEATFALGFDRDGATCLVEALGLVGVLEAPPRVGLATRFVPFAERDQRPTSRTEYESPLGFWSGKHGVSWENVAVLFGLSRTDELPALEPRPIAPRAPRRRAPPSPAARAQRPRQPKLTRRPPQPGDVWSIRVREDAWVMLYVWALEMHGRSHASVEFLEGVSTEAPLAAPPAPAVQPRYDGRWQYFARGLEKVTGSALVAVGVAPPRASAPPPERSPYGGAKDLAHLAASCFPELRRA